MCVKILNELFLFTQQQLLSPYALNITHPSRKTPMRNIIKLVVVITLFCFIFVCFVCLSLITTTMPLKSIYESNLKLKYDSEIIFISYIPSSEYVCSLPLIIFAITLRSNCRFRVVGKVVISYYCV